VYAHLPSLSPPSHVVGSEGLLSVVTITLAIGSQHLAAQKAIVRSMPAIETLG